MKKLVSVTVALAALLLSFVSAQAEIDVTPGVKAGLNMSTLTGTDSEGMESKTGFAAGGFLRFSLSPTVAIQPEVLYTMKGAEGDAAGIDVTFKMDYIEIPVLLRMDIPTQGTAAPGFFVGPALGLSVTSNMEAEAGGTSLEWDITNEKSVDFGLVFGGGVDFAMGTGKLVVDARYTLGMGERFDDVDEVNSLSDITDMMDKGEFPMVWNDGTAAKLKNGAFSIMVGYGF